MRTPALGAISASGLDANTHSELSNSSGIDLTPRSRQEGDPHSFDLIHFLSACARQFPARMLYRSRLIIVIYVRKDGEEVGAVRSLCRASSRLG